MRLVASTRIGAEHGERSPELTGAPARGIPGSARWSFAYRKLREGSILRVCLSRGVSEKALLAVIQQARGGRVEARGRSGEGAGVFQEPGVAHLLDRVVDSFLDRPLDGGAYCLWLDALSVREEGRIVNVSVAVEYRGQEGIIGMDVGTSEDGAFWLAFLRSLSARGLSGVIW